MTDWRVAMSAIRDFSLCVKLTVLLLFQNVVGTPILAPFQVINLHEDISVQTVLANVNCIDTANAYNLCATCNIVATRNDSNNRLYGLNKTAPFDVLRWNSGSTQFAVVFVPNQGHDLDYSIIRTYYVDIQCEGVPGNKSAIQTLEIDIVPNQAPVISGLPGVSVTLDARNGQIGSLIYDVQVSDNETDTITYNMSVDPFRVDYFQIGKHSGHITAAKHLLTATVTPVTIMVNVSDGRHTVGPLTITVNLSNMNSRPGVTNLPMHVAVNEDAPPGTLIATLTLVDPDIFQAIDPNFTVNPVSEAAKFNFRKGTRQLRLAESSSGQNILDAESVGSINISFFLFDGYLSSVNEYILLTIANVNEPPYFSKAVYQCPLYKKDFGCKCDLGLNIRDPEGDAILDPSLKPDNKSKYFFLDDGRLEIVTDDGHLPTEATLTIQVADVHGATATAPIQVTVFNDDCGGSERQESCLLLITMAVLVTCIVLFNPAS